ncbi:MAG: helix-turn-helix transcriptional regulator [Cyclobacteriaceae bacterium]|jgi:transcriptional regulator with XRE-family HTH domain|nr:helix-turn-helix transcriptional regulator [Cytophagales bacterium]MCZ8328246.1 helix-turn-helix transcriptional regulator [Cyclobacteriaceae bacterium]
MKIGEFLELKRRQRGLSQKQLASLSGINYVQINRYEKNVSTPTKNNLEKLAVSLKLANHILINDTNYIQKEILRHEIETVISFDVPENQIKALREMVGIILNNLNIIDKKVDNL